MPTPILIQQQELILILKNSSCGLSIDEILSKISFTISKRTLQYRLSGLLKTGFIKLLGRGKSTRYVFAKDFEKPNEKADQNQRASPIPLSLTSQLLLEQVSAPVNTRNHVAYKKSFLESYIPGKTFYLSQEIRNKLLELGSIGNQEIRPAGTYARKILNRFLIDLSWNSSRLEGNTYSLLETEKLLISGEESPGKNDFDAQMILNHKDAIEFLVDMAENIDINSYTVLNIHALLSNNLLFDPNSCGNLRSMPVKIGHSVYQPPEVPQLIKECFDLIVHKASLINDPFEQSFFLMVHLPYLQPFLDVNKRVSRLAGNIPYIKHNLSPLSFVDVPQDDYIKGLLCVYELNRIELLRDVFVWAYQRSASLYNATLQTLGKPDPFRLKYRLELRCCVGEVVVGAMDKIRAAEFVSCFSKSRIPPQDALRFVEVAEYELSCLHQGNFARFKISPDNFFKWYNLWQK